jgi:hypothetical protein
MPEALIGGIASIAVALITAGVIGQNRKAKATKAAADPLLMSILDRWRDCEQRWLDRMKAGGSDGPL